MSSARKKKKGDEQSREKDMEKRKVRIEVEVNVSDNFLISGELQICEKGRSERFLFEH